MWYYKSAAGTMRIYEDDTGGYILRIGDTILDRKYPSYTIAAIDVHDFTTGCEGWDNLRGTVQPPENISEWTFGQANF